MKPSMAFIRQLSVSPRIAVALAAGLLLAALTLGFYAERLNAQEKLRQNQVQAEILAASVAAALAFDDAEAAQEYVSALQANPEIQAAAAYGVDGRRVAGFSRDGREPPAAFEAAPGPAVEAGSDLIVTGPVVQSGTRLGSVYLRSIRETLSRRATRYLATAVLFIMAALLLVVLGASNASLAEAHAKLRREVEEREKAEAALRQSQKMEAMGQLTGGVAHDFNNLLMVASSGLDLMDRTSDPAKRERLKQGIRQAIERGAGLTRQLLAFARRSPMNPEVIDLARQLQGMTSLLDRSLREDIEVEVRTPPGLWRIEADPTQLEVAVINVALNARDAMPNGGRIVIEAANVPAADGRGDMVRLSLTDSGVGVPAEMLPRVFEPFFTTKGVGKGTGLGLSQVYGFARASGGEADIRSEVGHGATVSLLLPRSEKPLAAERPGAAREAAKAGRCRRILLVEDDESVAALVNEMLKELGYEPTHARSAAAALETLAHGQPVDLVFSDMIMPGDMDGMDLAREIARRRPELPIVLTTGYSEAAASAAAEGLHLLVKPYRLDALAHELEAAFADRPAGAPH